MSSASDNACFYSHVFSFTYLDSAYTRRVGVAFANLSLEIGGLQPMLGTIDFSQSPYLRYARNEGIVGSFCALAIFWSKCGYETPNRA